MVSVLLLLAAAERLGRPRIEAEEELAAAAREPLQNLLRLAAAVRFIAI